MGARCRGTAAVAVLATLAVVPSAGARSRPNSFLYAIKRGKIDVAVRFRGDGTEACRRAGLCGYAGTIRYTLPADPGGLGTFTFAALDEDFAFGFITMFGRGRTVADVSFTDASGQVTQRCTDAAVHKLDAVTVESAGKRRVRVRLPRLDQGASGGS